MTNYEKFINMSIREFAETRIIWNGELDQYSNDTSNTYRGYEEEKEMAIQDEIEWLNLETI